MSGIVFKIGPLPLQGHEPRSAYFVFPGVSEKQVFFARDDRSALQQIRNTYPESLPACEPMMVDAAREFGFSVRDLTPDEANQLGLMALEMAIPGQMAKVRTTAVVFHFGTAAKVFSDAAPWRSYERRQIQVVTGGVCNWRKVALCLGTLDGTNAGLALYAGASELETAVSAIETGDVDAAMAIGTLGMTLESAPEFAAQAMIRAYGLPRVPRLIRVQNGERIAVTEDELLAFSGILRAVAALTTSRQNEANANITIDNHRQVNAFAFINLPSGDAV